jgi:PHD/YefM family antitoxin component YafN of YafNO toxin-antitoxin module
MRATQKKQTDKQAESLRRTLQILEDEKAMEGIYQAQAEIERGERGTPLKDLKRKPRRA